MTFFQQQWSLLLLTHMTFKVLSTLQHVMFSKFFLRSQKKFMSFSSFNKYIYGQVTFFLLFILWEIRFWDLQKMKGAKQVRGITYNEKYLEVFSQRPFWYKKVFSEQWFSKTKGFKCFYVRNIMKFTITSLIKPSCKYLE